MDKKEITLTYRENISDYRPDVKFELGTNDFGFTMNILVDEANPMREKTEHFSDVCQDSCVEWFVNFQPEHCDRYFNFEMNALGTVNASFRKDRFDSEYLTAEDVEALNVQTRIYDDYWTVEYVVPFMLIKKYIPGYEFKKGMIISANFYKCGGRVRHFGMWKPILTERVDFHRPEYFGQILVE